MRKFLASMALAAPFIIGAGILLYWEGFSCFLLVYGLAFGVIVIAKASVTIADRIMNG